MNFSALEEFKKISKKTILDLYRHYFMDYIMFGLNSSTIDLLLDDNNLRLPHADLFKRKNSPPISNNLKRGLHPLLNII